MQLQAKLDSTGIECLRELFEELALEAGRIILDLRARGIEARAKADASPVTEADIQAERLICAGLARHFPAILIIAEESAAASRLPANAGAQFVLIDPLDGTREFIAGRDEYTVNLALVQAGQPVMGVILAPAHGLLYSGRSGLAERIRIDPDGKPGPREPIRVAPMRTPLRILASRSHRTAETDAFLQRFADAEIVAAGSSLKFCRLAEGNADLYPRFGPTMQWDTAAGDAILRAAGGMTCGLDGLPLLYGKSDRRNLSIGGAPSAMPQTGKNAAGVSHCFSNPHFIACAAPGWFEAYPEFFPASAARR